MDNDGCALGLFAVLFVLFLAAFVIVEVLPVTDYLVPEAEAMTTCDQAQAVGDNACNFEGEKIDLWDAGTLALCCGAGLAVLGAIPLALIAFGSWR